MTSGQAADSRSVWLLWLLLAFTTGIAFPYFERFMNANERPRLLQAMALVDDGTWAIDGPVSRGVAAGIDVARFEGRLYSNKPPGASLVAAVTLGVGRATFEAADRPWTLRAHTQLARLFGAWLPTLVIAGIGLRASSSGQQRAAWLLYAIGTPALAYSKVLFGHQLAAAALFVGVWALVRAVERSRPGWALLGGALAGAAVAVEYGAAFAGLPIAVWLAMHLPDRSRRASILASVVGASIPIVALGLYHRAAFGSFGSTPYHHVVDPGFASIHGRGLLGLTWPTLDSLYEHLLSPWGGALVWAPLCLIGFAESMARWRRGQADARERLFAAIFGLLLLFNLGLAQTGGWRVGPRYLVVAMPFTVIGLGHAIERVRTSGWRFAALVAVAGWSVGINFLAANLFPHLVPHGEPVGDLLVPLLAADVQPHGLPAWLGFGEFTLAIAATLTCAVFGLAIAMCRASWRAIGLGACGCAALLGLASFGTGSLETEADLEAIIGIWEPRPGGSPPSRELR